MAGNNRESLTGGPRFTRKEFNGKAAQLALAFIFLETAGWIGTSLAAGSQIQRYIGSRMMKSLAGQTNPQFGVNVNVGNIHWFGLDQKNTLDTVLSLPAIERARISIPPDEVAPEEDRAKWNVGVRDSLIREAIVKGLRVDLQLGGLKTAGGREVNTPLWLNKKHPELLQPYTQLDKHPEVQDFALSVVGLTANHILKEFGEYIDSIQVGNEPLSRRLPLTKFRYISESFIDREVDSVRKIMKQYGKESIPILQNIPLDTPEAWWHVLTHNDAIGVNFYNQYSGLRIPEEYLWKLTDAIFFAARLLGKKTFITEYQSAAWLDGNKEATSPFDAEKRWSGLQRLMTLRPTAICLWDVEQLLWRAHNGDPQQLEFLNSLSQLP